MDENYSLSGVLAVRGVSAGYKGRPVVNNISLTLRFGAIMGLLGANGSGKSTLIKAITGQIRALSGSVEICGEDLAREPERAKAALGLAVDTQDLPTPLSARQYFELVASIRGCAPDSWPCAGMMSRLGLEDWLSRPIRECSLGTRAKISIAAALLGSPPLLIFDESLNGLDPVAAWEVKRIVRDMAASGKHAVIISTHVVEAVPSLCNQALFLAGGRIVQSWDGPGLVRASAVPGGFEACVMQALQTYSARLAAIA